MQGGSYTASRQRCKKKNVEDGLRTADDQAGGPGDIPSELLHMAPCQAETDFTYLYIEVLRLSHNAIGCPRGPFVPFISTPRSSEDKLGDVAGRRSMSTSLRQRPLNLAHGRHQVGG